MDKKQEPQAPMEEVVSHTEKPPKKDRSLLRYVLLSILFGLMLAIGVAVFGVCSWYKETFNLEFKELLYTLASPLKGTGESTVKDVIRACLPAALGFLCAYTIAVILLYHKSLLARILRCVGMVLCAQVLVASMLFAVYALRVPGYIKALREKTTVYEDYYVDPAKVDITAAGEPKNLIYIYVESMETTYAYYDGGSGNKVNFIPNLTEIAAENISFSNHEDGSLGGFHTPLGTGWTMSALLATTSGIPFSFPLGENGHNKMSQRESFASGLTTLGDVLEEKGYRQEFLCGSDSAFAGRDTYFEQHGNYEIFDLFTAREEGYIPEDYKVFWGYEDKRLFEIAKDELLELSAGDQPFNLTMLTVDMHHTGGYLCEDCEDIYDYESNRDPRRKLANVVRCADRQISEFLAWCEQQDFYEDTVIVITGDHPRMDTILVSGVAYDDRTIYNCFINAAATPESELNGRTFTSFDIFPTTLAAMGFLIEGNRLGLGVNLFSAEPTLAEQLGYKELETEINKFSDYYIREFS